MASADDIDTLTVEGWRFGQYGPGLDPAVFAMYSGGSPWSQSDFSPSDITPSFVATPEPIEEVKVEANRTFVAPPVPPTLLAPIIETGASILTSVGAGLAGLVGLLLPTPTAPRDLDEAPDPSIETVDITGRVKPPTKPPPLSNDVPMPPNWNDLVNWRGPTMNPDTPFTTFAIPGDLFSDYLDRQPAPDRERRDDRAPRTPRSDPADGQLDEVTLTARRPRDRPVDLGAPYIFSDPLELPFGFPDGLPAPEPLALPQPERRAKPIRSPRPVVTPFADPFSVVDPVLDFAPFNPTDVDDVVTPITNVPTPAPPRGAPQPFLPPIVGDVPGSSFDPVADPLLPPTRTPTKADTCSCAKKPSKPRKPRTVCYRGTYTETSSGLSKSPKEEIPCQ